jgi:hypothetical protein
LAGEEGGVDVVNDIGVDEMDDMENVGDTSTKKDVEGKEVVDELMSDGNDVVDELISDGNDVVDELISDGNDVVDEFNS